MQIKASVTNRTLILALQGEVDDCGYKKVRESIDEALDRQLYQNVVFDFSDVNFMDSTGIGMLIGRYKILRKYGKPGFIAGANRSVEKILEMSGIYKIMPKVSGGAEL